MAVLLEAQCHVNYSTYLTCQITGRLVYGQNLSLELAQALIIASRLCHALTLAHIALAP